MKTVGIPTLSLDGLQAGFSLQARVDRKYLIDPVLAWRLVDELSGELQVLEIEGKRLFDYRSTYFDTPDLDFYMASARCRRKRFKVRLRSYSSSPGIMLEVKCRDGRGRTVKSRVPYHGEWSRLDDRYQPFLADVFAGQQTDIQHLEYSLTTNYQRMTFVDVESSARMTFDSALRCSDVDGPEVSLAVAVIETKSDGAPALFDRWLWSQGCRPQKFSKYCTGLASLRPELPRNKWHRVLNRHFA